MYKAIVCKLSDVRQHPNADRLKVANALGYMVIVGQDAKDGDLGVIFPCDGKLSHKMLMANNLYRKDPVTNEKMGGYFEANGRVKAVKLRGQMSDGFFTSLSSLDWAGPNNLKEGDEFDTINGEVVCQKYYTPATIRAMKRAAKQYKKPWWLPKFLVKYHRKMVVNKKKHDPAPTFSKHFDTTKLRQFVHMIPPNLTVYVSSKFHGTSGRSGRVPYDNRKWYQKLLKSETPYRLVKGTRNVTHNPDSKVDNGYYKNTDFRERAHKQVIAMGLYKDEIVYYEIVGYSGDATKIMPDHNVEDKDLKSCGYSKEEIKEFRAKYGDRASYVYGCKPGEFEIYVYRITQKGKDLSNKHMIMRCDQLGLNVVPQLTTVRSDVDLMKLSADLSSQEDMDGQIREGVCLRLEDEDGNLVKILKYKSDLFCILEGIKKNSDDYVDMEEIS